jgi:hypothetical protein
VSIRQTAQGEIAFDRHEKTRGAATPQGIFIAAKRQRFPQARPFPAGFAFLGCRFSQKIAQIDATRIGPCIALACRNFADSSRALTDRLER